MRRPLMSILWHSVIVILAACSALPAPATPTVTAIPATATAAATSTPASTRTPTPPPTATQVDINHLRLGEVVHIELKSIKGNELVNGDFSSHAVGGTLNGGIPLIRHADQNNPFGFPDSIPMYVYVQQGLEAPYFQPKEGKGNLTPLLVTRIVQRFVKDTGRPLNMDAYFAASELMQRDQGWLPLAFTTGEGELRYYPSAVGGYRVFFVPYESLDAAKDLKVIRLSDGPYRFRLIESVDEHRNLIYVVGSKRPIPSVPEGDFANVAFLGLARVINGADQSEQLLLQQKFTPVFFEIALISGPTIQISNTP